MNPAESSHESRRPKASSLLQKVLFPDKERRAVNALILPTAMILGWLFTRNPILWFIVVVALMYSISTAAVLITTLFGKEQPRRAPWYFRIRFSIVAVFVEFVSLFALLEWSTTYLALAAICGLIYAAAFYLSWALCRHKMEDIGYIW